MNFKLELPEDVVLLSRQELRSAIYEIITDLKEEQESQEIMTIQETAEYLKVSIPTVRSLIADNEIPFFKRGQIIRLNRLDVRDWMRNNSRGKML